MPMSTARAALGRLMAGSRATPIGVEAGESWLRLVQHDPAENPAWAAVEMRYMPAARRAGDLGAEIRRRMQREGMSRRLAVCALNSPSIECFPLSLSPKDEESLEDLLVEEVRERLAYPLEEAVVDYTVLPESVRKSSEEGVPVLVFAMQREAAESVLEILHAAGLDGRRLITPACALAPRLASSEPGQRRVLVVSSEGSTSVSAVQDGVVLVERILPGGVEAMIASLRSELRLSEQQCWSLLVPGSGTASGFEVLSRTGEASGALRSALVEILGPVYRDLAQEAAGCLGYCDSFLKPKRPASVVLCGLLSRDQALRGVLSQSMEAPVQDAAEALSLSDWDEEEGADSFALAAACALWDEEEGL